MSGIRSEVVERPREGISRGDDFVAWLNDQAAILRRGAFDRLDVDALAEELEDMAKAERRELENRFKVPLQHLLKWEFQADRRSRSWLLAMGEQRDQIATLLRDSPSLRNEIPWAIRESYPAAARRASDETGLPPGTFPAECPYEPDQVLSCDFRPGIPWDDEPPARPRRGRRR
ncbi:MAG TPA: DUF29 domain-containing protein [Geminicoccaceae bacterium]|nr:DUF29 domain-containing protein [Geminicoccaceae bacterium]